MIDEISPIADYIAKEMIANSAGNDVRRMLENNSFSGITCIADYQKLPFWQQLFGLGITPQQCVDMEASGHVAALISWALKVRQDGPWDHKPIIAKRFHPRNPGGPQHWHARDTTLYYYDVWSNIHYGYVGKAAGFSDAILLDGAGLEQIGSSIARLNVPQKDGASSGLRAWDDPHDRAGIEMGIALYLSRKANLKAKNVLDAVVQSTKVEKKPFVIAPKK